MKKLLIAIVGMTAVMTVMPEAVAGPHGRGRHKDNDGLRLAAGIVNLVKQVIAPTPTVVYQPAPAPVVVHRPAVVVKNHRPKYHKPARRPEPPRRAHAKPAPRKNNNRGGHRR